MIGLGLLDKDLCLDFLGCLDQVFFRMIVGFTWIIGSDFVKQFRFIKDWIFSVFLRLDRVILKDWIVLLSDVKMRTA